MHLVQWCSLQCSMQNLRKTITTQCLCKRQINSPTYCKEIHLFRPNFLVLPSHVKMKDAIFESTRWSAGDSFDLNLRAGCLSEPSQNQMSEIISNSSSFPKSFITDILNIFFLFSLTIISTLCSQFLNYSDYFQQQKQETLVLVLTVNNSGARLWSLFVKHRI